MGFFSDSGEDRKTNSVKKYLRSSEKKRRANDFKLAKEIFDSYDNMYGPDSERIDRMIENFDLHSGRWSRLEAMTTSNHIQVGDENFMLDDGALKHYPVIDIVSKSIVGDIINTPLIVTVKDESTKSRNYRDRVTIEKLQSFFNSKYIEPRVQELTQQHYAQLGITPESAGQIDPQQIQQIQQQVDQQVKQETPEEILSVFEKTRTPEEIMAQIVMNDAVKAQDVKNKFDIAGEYATVTAEWYCKVGIRNNEPTLKAWDPKKVTWVGSDGVENVEDGLMVKYEEYRTPEDIISEFGRDLVKGDIKTLEGFYTSIPTAYSKGGGSETVIYKEDGGREYLGHFNAAIADAVADNPIIQNTDFLTREGQQKLQALYSSIASNYSEGIGIRVCYMAWRWVREMKKITRFVDGKESTEIRDEHYMFNPLNGDIKEEIILAPQIWEATKIGEHGDCFFVGVGPIPYQYNNLQNAFDVKLPVFGGPLNTFEGNAKNTSFIDLGKVWNFKIDLKLKRMEEIEMTDIGVVLLTTAASKPAGWSWEDWYKSLRQGKMAISHSQFEGANQVDLQAIRSIDLGRKDDIQKHLMELDAYEKKLYQAMYYSEAGLGQLGQYTNSDVAQVAQQGAQSKMARFHNKLKVFKERTLTAFLNCALVAYKDNELKKSVLFDDYTRAYFENILDPFPIGQWSLYIVDDFNERRKVESFQQLALTMLQNGGNLSAIAEIYSAKSIAEIQEILDKTDRKIAKQAEIEHKRKMEELDKQSQVQQSLLERQLQEKAIESEKDRVSKEKISFNQSNMLAKANDINQDGVNDSLDRTLIEAKQKEEASTREHSLKLQELELKKQQLELEKHKANLDHERGLKELDIKNKQANSKKPV